MPKLNKPLSNAKRLSIKDIAKQANVSITTVSFILNGKAQQMAISAAVIEKVEKTIKESGYKPNQVARSLRTGNSKIIGLIVEDISNPFFASIARLIEDKAYKKGYKIMYSSTENDINKAKDLIDMLRSRNVDAYIIAPTLGIEEDVTQLLKDRKPIIFFDRNLPGLEIPYVGADHLEASYKAVESFITRGKKNIAFVSIDLQVQQIEERYIGYKKAIDDNGLKFNERLALKIPFNQPKEDTVNQIKSLLTTESIDAILFATNYLALSGLTAINELNKKINEDFLVIAYDDRDLFKLHTPKISAIEQPLESIAENVINLILSELDSKSNLDNNRQIILPTNLILR
ncbi:LacI family DNA-binding transcriptional regulator [Albibacterium sp.]|uniref:LacI family DNA-binding transcriptional regulator n=1 Tax=Albibacterium sp. TaxID=2952885 RepID=UPI002D7FE124|nr:LacI family DNA-binding transcriptional regulator [Albibacterium sp.]